MLRLLLLRHAKSDRPEGVADHERPLAPRGIRQSEAMGRYMAEHRLAPELAIVSTARRAQDTWRLAAPAFNATIPKQDERRIYEAAAGDILKVIQETDADKAVILLVGHNPGFEQLAGHLAGRGRPQALARLQKEFPTAGLAVIDFPLTDWSAITPGSGYLDRFETLATISN